MGQEILEDKLWCDDEQDHPGHLIWWAGLETDKAMADYRRFMSDLIALQKTTAGALGGGRARVPRQ